MPVLLSELTTMRVGGPARRHERAGSTAEVLHHVREADATGEPVLVMGGGSNLVVGDDGFDGLVLQVASTEMEIDDRTVRVDAGVEWDRVVVAALEAGLAGLEPLSGIPGSTGGTPIQNVGAYGTLTSSVLSRVTVYDRVEKSVEAWGPDRCGFGSHRQSVFKHSDRYVVLDVTFTLARSESSLPVAYPALAGQLDLPVGAVASARDVRAAVLELRRARAMLLDPGDHNTWSVGSFFINPVVTAVPEPARDCPQYPDPAGIKLSAGWLIEQAGFPRGYGRDWGRGAVALSSKHALAITNRGGATTADVMQFAALIRDGVAERFDIRLDPECDLVNCELG